jgi:hypothetical protein
VRLSQFRPTLLDALTVEGADGGPRAARTWMALGLVSLAAAAAVALIPGYMQDFAEVRGWFAVWRFGAGNPYLRLDLDVDYPPHAFLVLAPIGLLPEGLAGLVGYLMFNLVATVTAAYLLARWSTTLTGLRFTHDQIWALAGMVLAMGTTRSSIWLGQTIAIAMCLTLVAMLLVDRRPAWAALALAVASFKPHVVIAFGLALLLMGRLRVLLLAGVMSGALFVLFGLTVGSPPFEMVALYLANLDRLYRGTSHVLSVTSLREVFDAVAGDPIVGLRLHSLVAAGTLAWLLVAAWRSRRSRSRELLVAASCLLWSLIVLPHQRHSLVLLAPALWAVLWPETGCVKSAGGRRLMVALTVIVIVVDVPLALRLAAGVVTDGVAAARVLRETSYLLTRGLVVWCFVLVTRALARG